MSLVSQVMSLSLGIGMIFNLNFNHSNNKIMKIFTTTAASVAKLAAIALTVVSFTSCNSFMGAGEELEKIARLHGAPEKSLVELTAFSDESFKEIPVNNVAEYSYTNEDENVIKFQGTNCTINSITVDYGDVIDNKRLVTVSAFGTADKLAEAENGTNQVVATCSYTQQVPATPVQEDVYTYDVFPTVNNSADNCQSNTSYEVNRYLNGLLDKTWKFSVTNYEYLAYSGSDKLYAAADAEWKVALTLPEGNAVNSLGKTIAVDHGTSVEEKNVIAKVWKDGAFSELDETSVTMTVVEKYYYGDYTFCTTAGRISADGSYYLHTTQNLVFVDSLTGHREVLLDGNNGELSLTGAEYVNNPDAVASISDSEGRNYDYAGDYTVSVDVKINGTKVCSSNTVFPTYTVR